MFDICHTGEQNFAAFFNIQVSSMLKCLQYTERSSCHHTDNQQQTNVRLLVVNLPSVWSLRTGGVPAVFLPEWRQVSAPVCPPECPRWRRYEEHWSAPRH